MKPFLYFLAVLVITSCQSKVEVTKTEEVNSGPELKKDAYNVAFLIMDGTYNTEFTAPWDIFHHVRFREVEKGMNVFTVAKSKEPITTFEGLKIQPDFSYSQGDLPKIDILVVPSAEHHLDSDLRDQQLLNFISKASKSAQYVVSHCDGAFVLAKSGVLDGHISTTFPADVGAMREMFPSLDVRDSVLFVHHDKYITSAGGAKSFEASLYLCEMLYGKENADLLAEGMVIDWDLDSVPHLIVR